MLRERTVNGENVSAFQGLLPEPYVEAVYRGTLTGTATYDNRIESGRLVGLVMYRTLYSWVHIEWIALTERYRLPDYAADMIWNLEEAARRDENLTGIMSTIFPGEERLRSYFSMAGFRFSDGMPYTYTFPLSAVSKKISGVAKSPVKCLPVAECDAALIAKTSVLLRNESLTDFYASAQEISAVALQGEEPVGAVLITEQEGELSIDSLFGRTAAASASLLQFSYERALALYPPETLVTASASFEQSFKLIKTLAPDAKGQKYQLAYRTFEFA